MLNSVAHLTINHFSPYALLEDYESYGYNIATGERYRIMIMAFELMFVAYLAVIIFERKFLLF